METTTGSHYSQPPNNNYLPSVPLCVYGELTAELQAVQAKLDVVTNHNQKLAQENQQLRQEITKVIQSCLELQKLVGTSAPSASATVLPNQEGQYQPQSTSPRNQEIQYQPQPTPPANKEIQRQPQPTPRNNKEVRYTNKPTVTTTKPNQQPTAPRPKAVVKAKPPQNHRQHSAANIKDINFPVSETGFVEEEKVRYSPNPHSQTQGLNGWWLLITIILIMVTGFGAGYLIVRPLFQSQNQPLTIKN
jgi:hypothetical protein